MNAITLRVVVGVDIWMERGVRRDRSIEEKMHMCARPFYLRGDNCRTVSLCPCKEVLRRDKGPTITIGPRGNFSLRITHDSLQYKSAQILSHKYHPILSPLPPSSIFFIYTLTDYKHNVIHIHTYIFKFYLPVHV